VAEQPPVCPPEVERQIKAYPDDVITGPCPYRAGSAEKIVWLGERWNRFAIGRGIDKNGHLCPEVMHHKDDERMSRSIVRSTKASIDYSMPVTKLLVEE
jgi:hypothetical protein